MRLTCLLLCFCLVLPGVASAETTDSATPLSALDSGQQGRKIYYRLFGGLGTDEILLHILRGKISFNEERTGLLGFEIGTPLAERIFGYPIDLVAKLGLIRHLERGLQDDFNQYTVSTKAYFDGFPWRESLRTRFGLGVGLSYAERIPALEYKSLIDGGSNTSHLLLHLDVSLDLNLGDMLRSKSLDNCYFGVGVSHRSGVFGKIPLFNDTDGGYNYNVMNLECIVTY